jgi:hypothetical protein
MLRGASHRIRSTVNKLRRRARRKSLQAAYRQHYHQPAMEGLEPRMLLAADDVISVGRVLSAWTTPDIQNHELKITYTVYNQQSSDVSGTLLTTTLQPGVTFESATQLPDLNGQDLAWSLGTIPAFGRASVEVTVVLATTIPLQVDGGAHAFGTVNAVAVTDAAPAAKLRTDVIAPELLASTPDANTTDPFIQAVAAKYDYDPNQFFQFLTQDIGYESYVGSLRGARGTLWSSAGNSLDEASLGIALMRSSGIPARYVQGTLSDSLAQQLILSMFPASYQTVGYIPAGTATADPANDPELLEETKQHYWMQFDTGAGMRDADTIFADATIGQAFTVSQGTFTEIVDSLRHKTNVQIQVETFNAASGLFGGLGGGLGTETKLDATWNDSELVGRFVSAGNLLTQSNLNAIFTSTTNTYSPFLVVSDVAQLDLSGDIVVRGDDYQDFFTNFPLGSQIVTEVLLKFNLSGPSFTRQSFEYSLADRIGIVARHQGSSGISIDPSGRLYFLRSTLPLSRFSVESWELVSWTDYEIKQIRFRKSKLPLAPNSRTPQSLTASALC